MTTNNAHSDIVESLASGETAYIAEWLDDVIELDGFGDADNLAEATTLRNMLAA